MIKIPDMTRRFLCRVCMRETGHSPRSGAPARNSLRRRQGDETSSQKLEVVECRDCGSLTCCVDTQVHPVGGDSYTQSTVYYPPLPFRLKPPWYRQLPKRHRLISDEVYRALDHRLFRLAAVGVRSTLDLFIVETIGDIGSFQAKVKALSSEGMIDPGQKEMLLAVLDAGSASAHRNFRPNKKAMTQMMDILEGLLHKMMVAPGETRKLSAKAKALREKTPGRRRRPTTG